MVRIGIGILTDIEINGLNCAAIYCQISSIHMNQQTCKSVRFCSVQRVPVSTLLSLVHFARHFPLIGQWQPLDHLEGFLWHRVACGQDQDYFGTGR